MKKNHFSVKKIEINPTFLKDAEKLWRTLPPYISKPSFLSMGSIKDFSLVCVVDLSNPVKTFKIRGAFGAIKNLQDNGLLRSKIVAASSGSYGMSVACIGSRLNTDVRIFVPLTTPKNKIAQISNHGGLVTVSGKSYEETKAQAKEYALEAGASFVDGVCLGVFLGNASLALEVLHYFGHKQLSSKSKIAIVIPLGIGSLLVPFKLIMQNTKYSVDIIAIEPWSHAKLNTYLGGATPSFETTLADGAAVRELPEFSRNLVLKSLDFYGNVKDSFVLSTLRQFYKESGIKLEGAGVLSYSAVLSNLNFFSTYDLVFTIATGGNYPTGFYE